MIEVVVLGSGTSNGVPILGIEYPAAFLAEPKNHRTRPSILLKGPHGNLLVDCTPDMRTQLLREGIMDVHGVLITHIHADHIMGMDDLRAFSLKYKSAVPIYTLPVHQETIQRVFPYAFMEFPPGIDVPRYQLIDVPDELSFAGMDIQFFTVMHGKMPCTALRVNDFAYVTDVSEIPDEAMACLSGLDVLVLDAVRYAPHPNHFHYEKAIEVAQQIGATKTYFTHLSHDYDHHKVNSELPLGIELAWDGLRLRI